MDAPRAEDEKRFLTFEMRCLRNILEYHKKEVTSMVFPSESLRYQVCEEGIQTRFCKQKTTRKITKTMGGTNKEGHLPCSLTLSSRTRKASNMKFVP